MKGDKKRGWLSLLSLILDNDGDERIGLTDTIMDIILGHWELDLTPESIKTVEAEDLDTS
jgi:hypothetical protein